MKKLSIILGVCAGVLALWSAHVLAATKDQPAQQQFKPREVKVDRNYDGVPERIEYYNDKGVITRVEGDTNADGKVDEWVYYEDGIAVKGAKDLNGDGKPDTTMFYDAKGVITRTESDSNGDGKVDEWVYYSNGAPVRAEKDTNGDGKPDTWIKY